METAFIIVLQFTSGILAFMMGYAVANIRVLSMLRKVTMERTDEIIIREGRHSEDELTRKGYQNLIKGRLDVTDEILNITLPPFSRR